eukprot:symbB.v1.2.000193.t1/scaffold21.1/size436794/12
MVLRPSRHPRGLARLQRYTWLYLQGLPRARRKAQETKVEDGKSLLRRCLAQCVETESTVESMETYEAILQNLKISMSTSGKSPSRPPTRNDMVMRLERALRLDTECRQGQARVRRLRSSEDLSFL